MQSFFATLVVNYGSGESSKPASWWGRITSVGTRRGRPRRRRRITGRPDAITVNGLSEWARIYIPAARGGRPRSFFLKLDLNIVNYLSLIRGLAKWGRFMEQRGGASRGSGGLSAGRRTISRARFTATARGGSRPDPALNRNYPAASFISLRLMRCRPIRRTASEQQSIVQLRIKTVALTISFYEDASVTVRRGLPRTGPR